MGRETFTKTIDVVMEGKNRTSSVELFLSSININLDDSDNIDKAYNNI